MFARSNDGWKWQKKPSIWLQPALRLPSGNAFKTRKRPQIRNCLSRIHATLTAIPSEIEIFNHAFLSRRL